MVLKTTSSFLLNLHFEHLIFWKCLGGSNSFFWGLIIKPYLKYWWVVSIGGEIANSKMEFFMASLLFMKTIQKNHVFLDTVGSNSTFLLWNPVCLSIHSRTVAVCTFCSPRAMCGMFFLFQKLSSYFNAQVTQLRNPLKGSAFAGSLEEWPSDHITYIPLRFAVCCLECSFHCFHLNLSTKKLKNSYI